MRSICKAWIFDLWVLFSFAGVAGCAGGAGGGGGGGGCGSGGGGTTIGGGGPFCRVGGPVRIIAFSWMQQRSLHVRLTVAVALRRPPALRCVISRKRSGERPTGS